MRNLVILSLIVAGCEGGEIDGGVSTSRTEEGLSGCHGTASSAIPSSGAYYLTSFGFSPSDDGTMSCGEKTLHGSWYYAASRQRYGCGAHIRITANGRCVVAETDDYGPDVCVEGAAGRPIIDASPLVSEHLFGTQSAGWSDRYAIVVSVVDKSTPLGPCDGSTPAPPMAPPSTGAASCHSATLDENVAAGTCVQSASDGAWYHCSGGEWISGLPGTGSCSSTYAWCHSDTLDKDEPPRTCVESRFDDTWYQCTASGWQTHVANGAGPLGTCVAMY